MKIVALLMPIVASTLHQYVFSFQRFTLLIARKHASAEADAFELQLLMTPTRMGILGWLSTFSIVASAVVVGVAFAWWWGAIYLVLDFIILGPLLPLLPLRAHFASLSQRELGRNMSGPNAQVAAGLMIDVIRSGAGKSMA